MDAILKIRLADNDRIICGPGTEMLFDAIDLTGSVRGASEKTGMSYTKAWKIIHDAEANTGKTLVIRKNGGRSGGKAELTDDARKLLMLYREVSSRINEEAGRIMREISR